MEQDLISLMVNVDEDYLIDSLLEHIEETENTKMVLGLTKWLLSELDNYGNDCADVNIQEAFKLIKG